jgi:glutamine---fructose-6-phosphate transaminase (isomerizing)
LTTADVRRDPNAPLSGPPEPWAETDMPSPRDGPPWHMTEMIEAEPALADRLLGRLGARDSAAARLATAVRATAELGRPILVTGCGTSEHGAMATAEILDEALRAAGLVGGSGQAVPPVSVQAFEASLDGDLGGPGSLLIGISHEGATWATLAAMRAGKAAGATVALVTCSDRSPGAELADIVVATEELDRSWCHTIGYLAPILAATAVAGHIGGSHPGGQAVRGLLAAALEAGSIARTEDLAGVLAGTSHVVVSGSGADRIAARELVLKIEEGAHIPAASRDVETVLHGHLAGMDDSTGFVLILADARAAEARGKRAAGMLRGVAELGVRAGAILGSGYAESIPEGLTPAGRLVVRTADDLPDAVGALLGSAVPLQLLTERLARERGVNPDPIRRDDPRYLRAAEASTAG